MTEAELDNFNIRKSVLIKKCIQLEKENAELKGLVNQYKASKCGGISLVNRNMIISDQLTKAKKIIKDLLGSENTSCEEEMFFTIRKRAEDFIKE